MTAISATLTTTLSLYISLMFMRQRNEYISNKQNLNKNLFIVLVLRCQMSYLLADIWLTDDTSVRWQLFVYHLTFPDYVKLSIRHLLNNSWLNQLYRWWLQSTPHDTIWAILYNLHYVTYYTVYSTSHCLLNVTQSTPCHTSHTI